MSNRNSGLALDEHFDLSINTVGDVASVDPREDLEKDISTYVFQVIDQSLIGNRLTDNQLANLEDALTERVERDFRVESVSNISVRRQLSESSSNVEITVDSIFGQFTVSE